MGIQHLKILRIDVVQVIFAIHLIDHLLSEHQISAEVVDIPLYAITIDHSDDFLIGRNAALEVLLERRLLQLSVG